jgi:DNA polymerase (family X)
MSAAERIGNGEIAARLERLADLLELSGANAFRVRAYRTAAETILAHPGSVADVGEAELLALKGIGKDLARAVRDLVTTGRIPQLEELERSVPVGLLEVMRLPGVGPKRAAALWQGLGIRGLDDVEREAKAGRLAGLAGFGAKTQAKILAGIDRVRAHAARLRLVDAEAIVLPLLSSLRAVPGVRRVEGAGSFRRGRETVGDLDLLAAADDGEALMRALRDDRRVEEVLGSGATKTSVRLHGGLQVDLRVVEEEAFGAAWLYFTGSKAHNVELRARAAERGQRLSEYGLFDVDERGEAVTRLAGRSEEEVYDALDLPWLPPELREGRGELAAALAGRLPDLLTLDEIVGDLHMHTTWSDGVDTVEAMADACRRRGYRYLAITDHSQALRMTGGLDAEKLARQHEALDALVAADPGITILRGLEVDIRRNGTLDLDDDALERLDLVIVSVHSHFDLPQAEQTARIVRAVSHPRVHLLAHPTGRVLGRRDGYAVDLAEVVSAAAAHGVAVELNAAPQRLDLGDVALMEAVAAGCRVAINTDAHAVAGLDDMRFGVVTARRAWLGRDQVVNAWSLERLRGFLRKEGASSVGEGVSH